MSLKMRVIGVMKLSEKLFLGAAYLPTSTRPLVSEFEAQGG